MIKNLLEAIQLLDESVNSEYTKFYSSIDRDVFNKIISIDPTSTKDPTGKVVEIGLCSKELLLPRYMSGDTSFLNNPDRVTACFKLWIDHIGTYPRLNEFKTVKEFMQFVENPATAHNGTKLSSYRETPVDPITSIYDRFYSKNLDRDTFDKIIKLDPETNKDRIGDVAKNLLLLKYIKGDVDFIKNPDEIQNAIIEYYKIKSLLPSAKQQLGSYATVSDFINYVIKGPETEFITGLKTNEHVDCETHRMVKDDIDIIAESQNYVVIRPYSQLANYYIGGGYRTANGNAWCTNWEPNEDGTQQTTYWHQYGGPNHDLICFMRKGHERGTENRPFNWQLEIDDDGVNRYFLNGFDSHVENNTADFKNFLEANVTLIPQLLKCNKFTKNKEINEVSELLKYAGKPYIINNEQDLLKLKTLNYTKIIKAVEINNIETLPANTFVDFSSLTEVKFDNKLKVIGALAFKKCISLLSLSLPEGLETIEEEAFAECVALHGSIKIPNSLTQIKTRAFMDDKCQLKVDKDRTTKLTFDNIDKNWVLSHVKGIKVQK